MRAALAGDAASYRAFLAELTTMLRRYFLRRLGGDRLADAEDLIQDTLMAIHARRATYDPERPVTVWVHAIARYKLIDHFRSRRVRASVPLDDEAEFLAGPDDAEPAMARRDVGRMLDTLPAQQVALVRAVKIDGKSSRPQPPVGNVQIRREGFHPPRAQGARGQVWGKGRPCPRRMT